MGFKKHIKYIIVIVILLSSLNTFAQEDDYIRLWQDTYPGLCSHGIYLYNDSTFLFDTGCEQHVSVGCGKWQMIEDTIFMNEERPKQNVSSVLKQRDPSNDSTIMLLILDRKNQPVERFMAVGFPNEIHHSLFQDSYLSVDIQSTIKNPRTAQLRTFSAQESNEDGYITFSIENTDKIKLVSLALFNEDFVVNVNGFNRIMVKINTNPEIFHYPLFFTEWVEEYPDKIVAENGKTYYLRVKKEQ